MSSRAVDSISFPEQRARKSACGFNLCFASNVLRFSPVARKPHPQRRSGCPVSVSLEALGDRWSLLIIRDLMVRGYHTFREFEDSGEGIATNILTDRLRKLQAAGILTAGAEPTDRRKVGYRLTEKGIDLAPVILELLLWGARHEDTALPCALIEKMATEREPLLQEVRRRWQKRDLTPLIPGPTR